MNRRQFVASGVGVSTSLMAGCTGGDESAAGDDETTTDDSTTDENDGSTGSFRLLISDQPTAIDDFDSLDVSFASARVFRGDGEDMEQDPDVLEDDGDTDDDSAANDTNPDGAQEDNDAADSDTTQDGDDNGRGYEEFDLEGRTVDLTQVVGEKAIAVLADDLEEGMYSTIELRAQDIVGIVAGEQVEVMIPSDRLRIVKPFEIVTGEEISFVFDINVVKRGQQESYNLLPVIGKSGVIGRDVEVDEIEPDDGDDSAEAIND